MERFLTLSVKLPTPVDTGALISAIQVVRYVDCPSGKKKLDFLNPLISAWDHLEQFCPCVLLT